MITRFKRDDRDSIHGEETGQLNNRISITKYLLQRLHRVRYLLIKIIKMIKYEYKSNSIYTKSVAISPEKLKILDDLRGKKSKAGKLDEIINYYLTNKLNK